MAEPSKRSSLQGFGFLQKKNAAPSSPASATTPASSKRDLSLTLSLSSTSASPRSSRNNNPPNAAANDTPPPPSNRRSSLSYQSFQSIFDQETQDTSAVRAPIVAQRTRSNLAIRPGSGRESAGGRDGAPRTTSHSMTPGQGGHAQDVSVNPRTELQKLQDTAAKRVATLDYLKRTHEGSVYWLNTLHLPSSLPGTISPDQAPPSSYSLHSLPSFTPPKLARRAQNHLILGISLPTLLDAHSSSAPDYLRTLNDILADYETYQTLHPPDGHSTGSLGRSRLPSMFKRSANSSNKPLRRSHTSGSNGSIGLAESLSPPHSTSSFPPDHADPSTSNHTRSFSPTSPPPPTLPFLTSPSSTFSSSTTDPSESYNNLLTPHLPFALSYTDTFATLAEVLIDVYMTIARLVSTPERCTSAVVTAFAGADRRIKRLLVDGFVREVGDGVRDRVRAEVGGLGRLVLGGFM